MKNQHEASQNRALQFPNLLLQRYREEPASASASASEWHQQQLSAAVEPNSWIYLEHKSSDEWWCD